MGYCDDDRTEMNAFLENNLPKPVKTLRKAGLTRTDNTLNPRGVEVFLHFLLNQHKDEFAKYVETKLEEED